MAGAARPGMMQAIETALLSRRRSPHVVGHPLEPGREREHLDAHRGARQRDRNLQRRSVRRRSSSGCRRRAARFAAPAAGGAASAATAPRRRSAGRPAACVEGRSGVPGSPAASGATGRGAAGERTIARHRARPGRCAATRARRTRRRRAGCSSMARQSPPPRSSSPVDSSGVIGPPPEPGRFVCVSRRWRSMTRALGVCPRPSASGPWLPPRGAASILREHPPGRERRTA